MSSSADDRSTLRATKVAFSADCLVVDLSDGRSISVPLCWYPRLEHATTQERAKWEIFGQTAIHWPDIDEDISVAALLAGKPSSESQASLQKWLDARSA